MKNLNINLLMFLIISLFTSVNSENFSIFMISKINESFTNVLSDNKNDSIKLSTLKKLRNLTQKERNVYLEIDKMLKNKKSYLIADFQNPEQIKNKKGYIKYDLDSDGNIDTVSYEIETTRNEYGYFIVNKCKITINDKKIIYEHRDTGEVAGSINSIMLADVNSNDKYIEFYVVDGYLADRQETNFYVYKNNQITNTCSIGSKVLNRFGDGKIFFWEGCIDTKRNYELSEDLVLFFYDYNKGKFALTDNVIGRSIKFDYNIYLYQLKKDVICGAPVDVDEVIHRYPNKIIKTIKAGERMTIISIDGLIAKDYGGGYVNNDNGMKVKTEDGKTGWIGGFHMVWD